MEIDKKQVLKLYMEWVNKMCEEFEHKTSFEPKEIVNKICEIVEQIKYV